MSKRRDVEGRAGVRALSLLATPPNAVVLRALAEGPSGLAELQGRDGCPGSTLRARLRDLVEAAVVAPCEQGSPSARMEYELTVAGRELLLVAEALERWLAGSPQVGRPLGGEGAKAAIGALTGGWSTTLLRALAVKPLSVAELDSLIGDFSYPYLERRIAAMRLNGQVEARPAGGRETPYAVTSWLRRGVAPLLAAMRWERLHPVEGAARVAGIDVEALLLLAMPLLEPGDGLSGVCRLAVGLPAGGNGRHRPAGVLVGLRDGSVVSCSSRLDGSADAWAAGSLAAWLRALIDRDDAAIELGGDSRLAQALVGGLHGALFASAERQRAV